MITKKVIDTLYRKYNRRPESVYDLNLGLLFEHLIENHAIEVNEQSLIINSVSEDSPFHEIPLRHIHEIVEFGDDIVIVLHSSLIILNKNTSQVSIHIKNNPGGLMGLIHRHFAAKSI